MGDLVGITSHQVPCRKTNGEQDLDNKMQSVALRVGAESSGGKGRQTLLAVYSKQQQNKAKFEFCYTKKCRYRATIAMHVELAKPRAHQHKQKSSARREN